MEPPVDRHNSSSDTKPEGKTLRPEAGRDMERPRGGIKGPLLALGLLAAVVIIGFVVATF